MSKFSTIFIRTEEGGNLTISTTYRDGGYHGTCSIMIMTRRMSSSSSSYPGDVGCLEHIFALQETTILVWILDTK